MLDRMANNRNNRLQPFYRQTTPKILFQFAVRNDKKSCRWSESFQLHCPLIGWTWGPIWEWTKPQTLLQLRAEVNFIRYFCLLLSIWPDVSVVRGRGKIGNWMYKHRQALYTLFSWRTKYENVISEFLWWINGHFVTRIEFLHVWTFEIFLNLSNWNIFKVKGPVRKY